MTFLVLTLAYILYADDANIIITGSDINEIKLKLRKPALPLVWLGKIKSTQAQCKENALHDFL